MIQGAGIIDYSKKFLVTTTAELKSIKKYLFNKSVNSRIEIFRSPFYYRLKKPILLAAIWGSFVLITVFFLIILLPVIPISEKYSMSVDPIIIKDDMGTETHVAIRNTGTNALTNIVVEYGGATKPDVIPILNPGEKVSLSPPDGSVLNEVQVTTDQGINITKEYRTPASISFVGNSGFGG